jgi:hypothetical protein
MDWGGAAAGALPASWVVECAVVISGMPATRRQMPEDRGGTVV